MKRATKIAIGVGTALSFGLATAVVSAHPYGDGPGWGMGQDMGYGPASGMGQGIGGPGPMGAGRMGNGPMGQGPLMGHGMGPHDFANPSAAAESRLAGMKSELKITAAQESTWKAFADQTKQQAEAMQAWMSSAQGSAQATAPERLDLRNQMMKKRQEQMEKATIVFKDLYAVLTPEQKALADQHFGMMRGRDMAFNRPGK